jgi:hypothetical protein
MFSFFFGRELASELPDLTSQPATGGFCRVIQFFALTTGVLHYGKNLNGFTG